MRGCDAVAHFAAESHVDRSIHEPSPVIQTNITGTFTLLKVSRKLSVSRHAGFNVGEQASQSMVVNGFLPSGLKLLRREEGVDSA